MHQQRASASKQCRTQDSKAIMNKPTLFEDLQAKISQVMQQSPAKDLEKNMKAMMHQGFSKLDLLTREEFDVQAEVLARTRARLEALELRVAELEARLKS
jgi:BMFP domain-containing protein YqiC